MSSHFPDFDECVFNEDDCDSNADCINTIGSFQCACKTGFREDGRACQGMNNE